LAHPAFRPSRGPFSLFLSIWLLPLFPLGFGLSAGPASPHAGGALPDCRLPHRKTPPAAPPSPTLRARLTGGPHLSSLTSGPPELGHATPRAAQPYLGRYPSFYHPAIISPSLIPVLTLPPPSIVLTPLTPPLLSLDTPLWRSPGPYKRAMRPPTLTAPHPLSPELFRTLLRPRDELKPPSFVASGAPPLHHTSVAGEHLLSIASTGSSSPSIASEHWRAPAPARRTPVRRRHALCPSSTVDRHYPRSTAPWTRSMEFSVENLIRKSVISGILQRDPSVFPKTTRGP
jgi:hypothetical protein